MANQILIKESSNIKERVYVKGPENSITGLNSSLNPETSYLSNVFRDVFLPQGYPDSVSEDYLSYQLWDTLQAFCSTITNTLATRAILLGVGVGDEAASSISAAITWIMKDGVGMFARILFAWICGTHFDSDCKKWRLFADILNDIAICVEIFLLPYFKSQALIILCASTSIKALVGVAGGATRASITQHQAIRNNMADVSAKDGSQETCVNLVASCVGILLLSSFGESCTIIWIVFFLLTGLHLFSNFKAVKALNINKFNGERLNYVLKEYLLSGKIPSSLEANAHESVFLCSNKNNTRKICGYDIKIGQSIEKVARLGETYPLQLIIHLYNKRKYMILVNWRSRVIYILLDKNYSYYDALEAYFNAFIQGIAISHIMEEKTLLTNCGTQVQQHPNSILNKIIKTVENYKKFGASERMKVDVDFLINIDNVAAKEVDILTSLRKSDWSMDDTYLPIGPWRASWNDSLLPKGNDK